MTGEQRYNAAPALRDDWQKTLSGLPYNWDSYRGVPTTHDALHSLGGFAVVPCSDGGLQLEVHKNGYDLEIYVGPDGKLRGAFVAHKVPA